MGPRGRLRGPLTWQKSRCRGKAITTYAYPGIIIPKGELGMAFIEPTDPTPTPPAGHYGNYVEYNKTLRTWLVSFGIGVPAVLMVNPTLLESLKGSGRAEWVVGLFVIGCAFQIVIAFLNKTIAYHLYCGETAPPFMATWRYRCCETMSEWYWLDFFLDVGSLVAFGYAIFLMFNINLADALPVLVLQTPN